MNTKINVFIALLTSTLFTMPVRASGDITSKDFGSTLGLTWTEVSSSRENTVTINLPNGKQKYFHFDYKVPEGRTVYNEQLYLQTPDIDADFIGYNAEALMIQRYSAKNVNGSFINNGTGINIVNNYIEQGNGGTTIISNNSSSYNIGNITGNFINNNIGIYKSALGSISNITGVFAGNGAAIYNSAVLELLGSADSGTSMEEDTQNSEINISNSKFYANGGKQSGAVFLTSDSKITNSDFTANHTEITVNRENIQDTESTIENRANISHYIQGGRAGAVTTSGNLSVSNSSFDGNYAVISKEAPSTESTIIPNMVIQYHFSTSGIAGALYADLTKSMTGSFLAQAQPTVPPILLQSTSETPASYSILNISNSNFSNNSVVLGAKEKAAGAIFININNDKAEEMLQTASASPDEQQPVKYNIDIINSNFTNNTVTGMAENSAGAIFVDFNGQKMLPQENQGVLDLLKTSSENKKQSSIAEINIISKNGNSVFENNFAGNKPNDIYILGTAANITDDDTTIRDTDMAEEMVPFAADDAAGLTTSKKNNFTNLNLIADNGSTTFNSGINGENYNINISTYNNGVIKINAPVENVANFTMTDNSVVHLGLNADIQAQNMIASGSQIVSQNAISSPILTVDVKVDKEASKVNSGAIHVSNDISGNYRILVNALTPDILDNKDDAVIPFLFAPNDDEKTASSFSIARVIGSPYLWDGAVNVGGEDSGQTWYLNLTDIINPDYDASLISPEAIAGMGLHEAAIEQTRSVVRNVRNKVADGRIYCPNCGLYDYGWNGNKNRNIWVTAQGETATIDKPVKMDADIWGVEAGFDVQNDVNNTLGVFASYRKGEYDLSGKADKVRSNIGSEIDIDSYLAGLYYRYDKNMNWLFATVYGGIQQADAKTNDGIAKFDTDGVEFGASVEAGHTFALSNDLTLDPSLGLYYTQVNFDDAKDNVGKEYSWKDIKHLEAELGAKLEKQLDTAKLYIKPSIIQTVTGGDSVKVTGLNKLSTYDDGTLGRIELGGRYGFTDALSAYGWVNYTFGSDYDATAFGLGVNYSW